MRERNPSFSLRALARDAGLSASYVSEILKGKKSVTRATLEKLSKALRLDSIDRDTVLNTIDRKTSKRVNSKFTKYSVKSSRTYAVLNHWYYLAILDFVECTNFSIEHIAKRFGLRESEAKNAWAFLIENGWVVMRGDRWTKSDPYQRFDTKESQTAIRNFHVEMIAKATEQLVDKTSASDFERRLINGLTFSADPAKIEVARSMLNQVVYEIAELLSDSDNCTDVYQLNLQLFPLTTDTR